jgi:hypothetical protein
MDHFSLLFAFSSDGHTQLTCIGIALAIARLIASRQAAIVAVLGKLGAKQEDRDDFDDSGSSDLDGIKDDYRKEMGSITADAGHALSLFWDLPGRVVDQDVHLGNIPWFGLGEKLEHDSQVRHFMRSRPEVSSDQAYLASVKYIRDHMTLAWRALAKARIDLNNRSFFSDPAFGDSDDFLDELSKALHTVEDSYAPGHVTRNAHELIEEVHIWDDANKNANPKTGWPGHSALDEPTHPMTAPHFRAAGFATRDMILCILTTFDQQEPAFQAALNGAISKHFSGICVM